VREAEATMRERAASGDTTPHDAATLPLADERMELRPSRQFESAAALSRLSVVPRDDGTASRGGWTVPLAKSRRRVDRSAAILAATYGVAVLLAVAMVVL
jgi:hypothetical protein